jgi:hypothetical protein
MTTSNPFQVQGLVEPPWFTNRADEIRRVRDALLDPPTKLLLYGDRRMGKTSLLHMARRGAERKGGAVVMADFSTASTVADLGNRLLAAAARGLGRTWREFVTDLVSRLRITARLVPDPVTGLIVPTLEAGLREQDLETQQATLQGILDTLDAMAGERGAKLGVVLDEFQEIHRLGGEAAEWHLRGVIQSHRHVAYVLSGSRTALIRRMLEKGRAFYKLFDLLHLGPIEPRHFARWIDERMIDGARPCPGVGTRCIQVAGPRTRDVVQLARACWDVAGSAPGLEPSQCVDLAFRQVVESEDDPIRAWWAKLTPHQQNVLRAVAGSEVGLTTRETLSRFALGHSGSVSNSAGALVEDDRLVRVDRASGYDFDSPFVRGWVVMNALPDVGIHLPVTWRAGIGRLT